MSSEDVNELCRFYQPHLPLYAEGELKDSYLVERVQAHVWCCSECQDWLEDYEDLTHAIFDSKSSVTTSLTIAEKIEGGFDGDFGDEFAGTQSERVSRILGAIKRREAFRRRSRRVALWSTAAVFFLLASVVVAVWSGIDERPWPETVSHPPRESGHVVMIVPPSQEVSPRLTVSPRIIASQRVNMETPIASPSWVLRNVSQQVALDAKEPACVGFVRYDTDLRDWSFEASTEDAFYHPSCDGWIFLVPDQQRDSVQPTRREAIPVRLLSVRSHAHDDSTGDFVGHAADEISATTLFRILFVPADPPRRLLRRLAVGADEKPFQKKVSAHLDPSRIVQQFSRSVEGVTLLQY